MGCGASAAPPDNMPQNANHPTPENILLAHEKVVTTSTAGTQDKLALQLNVNMFDSLQQRTGTQVSVDKTGEVGPSLSEALLV